MLDDIEVVSVEPLGHDGDESLVNRLLRLVAEHPLDGQVGVESGAVLADGDDSVGALLDQRAKALHVLDERQQFRLETGASSDRPEDAIAGTPGRIR